MCFSENFAASRSSRADEMNAGPTNISSKPSCHAFSYLRKNILSVNKATVPESKSHWKRKFSGLTKSRVHCILKFDDDAKGKPYGSYQQHNMMQDHSGEQSRMEETTDKKLQCRPRASRLVFAKSRRYGL